ncbi:hypothetical protein ACIGB6_10355 [Paeniglutamicibacter gangotriensis]|uniref:hypothetical protein n=1 Tax=Paeniglutamicibacter gangotriensis TaxID=254787 RepID=UPI0037C80402
MSRNVDSTVQKLGHLGGRTFLLSVAGLAAAAGLLAVLYLVWFTAVHFTQSFFFEASLVTPLSSVPDLRGTTGESFVTYGTANIESYESLWGPRLALAASEALYFLLFIAGCIAVILICRRLWKNQPFTALVHWTLLVLGALAAAAALLAPWLKDVSTHLAVLELGLPSPALGLPEDPGDISWVASSAQFSFQDANHSLLAIGVVLILLSLVMRRGVKLHQATDGLV